MKWKVTAAHAPVLERLSHGLVANVYSVHRQAVNLRVGAEVVALVAPPVGAGPGLLQVPGLDGFHLGWEPGATVWAVDGRLQPGRGGTVVWEGASAWEPPEAPAMTGRGGIALARAWLREALEGAPILGAFGLFPRGPPGRRRTAGGAEVDRTPEVAQGGATAQGVVGAAAELAREAQGRALAAVRQRARSSLAALAGGLLAVEKPGAEQAVRRGVHGLVGLGPGLTPSGDDLLAGALFTLVRAGHPGAGLLRTVVEERLRAGGTGLLLSAHFLRWAGRGVAFEHGTYLVDLLLASGDLRPRAAALEAVLGHGATSGADWAAGVLVALDVMVEGR